MNKRMPNVVETAAELRRLLRRERDYRRRERLLTLYLLASGQAHSRLDVARVLGVSRNTVARWLDKYDKGGLQRLLEIGKPSGRKSSLPQELLAELSERLSQPEKTTSYRQLWMELRDKYGVPITYHALYRHIRALRREGEKRK